MLKIRFLLSVLTSLTLFNVCSGQSDSIKVPERPKVVVFEEISQPTYSKPIADVMNHSNALKLAPLSIVVGDIPISFERKLNQKVSIEAGIGLTSRNYLHEVFSFSEYTYGESIERNYLFSYSLSGALRYYANEVFDGFYFGPQFRQRNYSSEVTSCHNIAIKPGVKESRTLQEFTIQMGTMNYVTNNVFLDIYVGLGARMVEEKLGYCQSSITYDDYSYYPTTSYVFILEPSSRQTLTVNGGFKLGLTF